MGERKGVNKYYPPDFDPAKHQSLDKYHGTHPLRERARKMGQGILIIRFEMPYNIWCGGCGIHIGMGVRYNAEKKKVGNYYTTPIYQFRMKCHLCDNHFEIRTDPKNHDYEIVTGARRKEQRWDHHENEQIVPEDRDTIKKIATDAMFKLEHGADDKQKIKSAKPQLAQLQEVKSTMKDDYILNKIARNMFRGQKKAMNEAASKDRALLQKASLEIDLVEEESMDTRVAGLIKFTETQTYDEKQKQKRKDIESKSIFKNQQNKSSLGQLKIISTNSKKSSFSSPTKPTTDLQQTRRSLGIKQSPKSPCSSLNESETIITNRVDCVKLDPRSRNDATSEPSTSSVEVNRTIGSSNNASTTLHGLVSAYGESSDSCDSDNEIK